MALSGVRRGAGGMEEARERPATGSQIRFLLVIPGIWDILLSAIFGPVDAREQDS
jgi:hypothetical protein